MAPKDDKQDVPERAGLSRRGTCGRRFGLREGVARHTHARLVTRDVLAGAPLQKSSRVTAGIQPT